MKRIFAIVLCVCMLILANGCTPDAVPNPMSYPDYTFDATPNTTQLRETAVRAMRDILTVQWQTEDSFSYSKSGPLNNREFQYAPGNIYAGILYTSANAGLFQFMEYYNQKTGTLGYTGSTNQMVGDIGVSCADAVLWAWSTVCTSIYGPFYPNAMVYKNGYIPVGDYTYDYDLMTYAYLPTLRIVNDNGKDVMVNAYAQVLPADALLSSTDNHTMMAIEAAHVEYLDDGSIDTENSYIMIQDQRAGGEAWKQTDEAGNTLYYSGRTSAKYTFNTLLEKHYIPVTAAEFIGEKAYEAATVSISNETCNSIEALRDTSVESNYPLAVVNLIADGKVIDRVFFSGTSNAGVPRSYALEKITAIKGFENLQYNKPNTVIRVEVVVATGERFVPIEFTI